MAANESALTADELRRRLIYDPATGVFTRRIFGGGYAAGTVAGTVRPNGYIQISLIRHLYLAHRLAWLYMTGGWPPGELDHKDTVHNNNRWGNLRLATHTQNQGNLPVTKRNTSGFKGVSWDKANRKWLAMISDNGRQMNLGRYATAEQAHAAYEAAAHRIHGEFARAA